MAAKAEVELDIFSGRPNPTWELSNADAAELERRLSALQTTSARTLFDGLGYRGLIVRIAKDSQATTARIQTGLVELSGGSATTYLEDRERALERWLVSTGKSAIGEDLFKLVEAELAK